MNKMPKSTEDPKIEYFFGLLSIRYAKNCCFYFPKNDELPMLGMHNVQITYNFFSQFQSSYPFTV